MNTRLKQILKEVRGTKAQHAYTDGAVLIRFEEQHERDARNSDKLTMYYIPRGNRFDISFKRRRVRREFPKIWRESVTEQTKTMYAGEDEQIAAAVYSSIEWAMETYGVS